eukprot:TRINITY_DN5313_c3_g1_i1.p1 TRINITY_DN5313_c3_g1~~TRINITY_DN5313_c3_g1_i1.p1  ORF type:complete len:191 (+),score=29.36 TRINITY_DN5313_c3_g1_i1:47-619(+)
MVCEVIDPQRAFAKDCYQQLEGLGDELMQVIGDQEERRLHINTTAPPCVRYLWPALAPERKTASTADKRVSGIVPRAIYEHFSRKGFDFKITCRSSLRRSEPLALCLTGCRKDAGRRRHPYSNVIAFCLSKSLFADLVTEISLWTPHPDDTAKALLNSYLKGDLSMPDDPSSLFPGSTWQSASDNRIRHM